MFFKKYKELILGGLMLAFTVFYLVITTQLKVKAGSVVNAATLPYLLSALMGILSISQIVVGIRALRRFDAAKAAEEEAKAEKPDNVTLLKTIALIVAYILLIEPAGFIIATVLYLFLQFIVLTPADQKPKYWLYILIAVLVAVIVYLGFRYGLQLKLPQGLIKVV